MKSPGLLAVLISSGLLSLIVAGTRADSQSSAAAKPQPRAAALHSSNASQQPLIIFVQTPAISGDDLLNRFSEGSRIVRTTSGPTASNVVNLTPEFFAAADPQVSFDASRILFSAQSQPGARWQIWEMRADGSAKRQVTRLEFDCLRPGYLAHEEFVFTIVTAEGSEKILVCHRTFPSHRLCRGSVR